MNNLNEQLNRVKELMGLNEQLRLKPSTGSEPEVGMEVDDTERMINDLGFGENVIWPCFTKHIPNISQITQITMEQTIGVMEKAGYIGTQSDRTGCFFPSTAGRQDMGNLIYVSSLENNYSQDCKDKLKANNHTEVIDCYNEAIKNKFGENHKSLVS